jgi:hypothetical protein
MMKEKRKKIDKETSASSLILHYHHPHLFSLTEPFNWNNTNLGLRFTVLNGFRDGSWI